jgi:hypothetical protein
MTSTTATAPVRTRSRRRRLRLGGVAIAAGVLVAATACNATMDGQTLTAIDAQEESFFSNGDEPYLAVIQFRVIPGVPGSTHVQFLGNLAEIAQNIDDGDSATIPDSMALASFPDVQYANLQQIIGGTSPEIVGAVTVAMESDASPWSAINGIMNDVAAELDHQLRTQIEPMTFLDIVNGDTAATKLADAATAIQAAAEPEFWQAVGIFFSSFGDPDDVIGFKVLFNVAVSGSDLQDIVDTKLGSGMPAAVVGGALRNEPLDVDYAGDGATYRVRWNIGSS